MIPEKEVQYFPVTAHFPDIHLSPLYFALSGDSRYSGFKYQQNKMKWTGKITPDLKSISTYQWNQHWIRSPPHFGVHYWVQILNSTFSLLAFNFWLFPHLLLKVWVTLLIRKSKSWKTDWKFLPAHFLQSWMYNAINTSWLRGISVEGSFMSQLPLCLFSQMENSTMVDFAS